MQHAHIRKLIDHPPVVTPALCLSTLTTLNAQVDGVKIPEGNRKKVIVSQDNNITIECKASQYFFTTVYTCCWNRSLLLFCNVIKPSFSLIS